ncbi:MAG: hypothetical protein ACI9MS_000673, partial [Glaciecola sp.]
MLVIYATDAFDDTPIIHGAELFHNSDRAIQMLDICKDKSMAIQVMVA